MKAPTLENSRVRLTLLYLSNYDQEFLVLDGKTGKELGSARIGMTGASGPIEQGRFLLLGTERGSVAVINPEALE